MKHIYSTLGNSIRILSLAGLLSLSTFSFAQNSTNVQTSKNCGDVIENFDLGNGGYTSPSLYGDQREDSAFYYKKSLGFWTERGEDGAIRANPIIPRYVSILSTAYASPSQAGYFDVGFAYVVPNPAVDQFNIALIRLVTRSGGETIASTVARSTFKTFTEFQTGTIQPYSDTAGHFGQRGTVCMRLVDADIIKGDTVMYRVEVTYWIKSANVTGNNYTIFDDLSLSNGQQGPLPVDFMGIVAKKTSEGGIHIKWDVANEINVKEYQIERSADGKSYSVIGSVPANGQTIYSFMDGRPIPGAAYYRVKNVDIDGKFKYTSVVKLNSSGTSYGSTLRAYPSPAQEQVTIEHRKLNEQAKITISTLDGRALKTVIPASGASHTPVNLSGLPKGMYIVRLEDGENPVETSKLVKQ